MSFAELDENDQEIVSAMHHMLLNHWIAAAGKAWASYQVYGRGAVILDFRPYREPPDDLPFAGYARLQDIAPADPKLAQLRELVQGYNPEAEALFVLYTPLGDTVIELVPALEGRPTPPEAASISRRK